MNEWILYFGLKVPYKKTIQIQYKYKSYKYNILFPVSYCIHSATKVLYQPFPIWVNVMWFWVNVMSFSMWRSVSLYCGEVSKSSYLGGVFWFGGCTHIRGGVLHFRATVGSYILFLKSSQLTIRRQWSAVTHSQVPVWGAATAVMDRMPGVRHGGILHNHIPCLWPLTWRWNTILILISTKRGQKRVLMPDDMFVPSVGYTDTRPAL